MTADLRAADAREHEARTAELRDTVVEAAKAWRANIAGPNYPAAANMLAAAVDTLKSYEEEQR